MMSTLHKDLRETRGSVLIVAIIFATVAALSLGSYVRLANTEMRLANHQFYGNASLNLAEAGVEEALYAINLSSLGDENWSSTGLADTLGKYVNSIELGRGATGSYRVHVAGAESNAPMIVSEGDVRSGGNGRNVRQIEVLLYQRSLFGGNDLMGDRITMNGNATVNSYSSKTGEFLQQAKVASTSLEEGNMDLGNATIYGSVATRGWDPVTRPNSEITEGITNDFQSSLPDVQLPDSDETINWHYTYDGGPGTLDGGHYKVDDINIAGDGEDNLLRIQGDVVLIVENDIDIKGSAGVLIEDGASLTIYVNGDVSVAGTGVVNESQTPSQFQLYGTNLESQTFNLSGNAAWYGAVYAPNASITLNGGGNVGAFYGAMIGNDITLNGGAEFIGDADLAELLLDDSFAMANWRELFGNDRYTFD